MEVIQNCFNYMGSKDRILPYIDENLDKSKPYFMDVFCGSGVVSINEINNYKKLILNDACWQLVETLRYFRDTDQKDILKKIESFINVFELSKDNKEGFNLLRNFYNNYCFNPETFNPMAFYSLIMHSFNYNIHISKTNGFATSSGKGRSYFNDSIKNKLINFQQVLHDNKNKISIKNKNYAHLIKETKDLIPKFMIYCDPPYLSSDDSYSRIYYLGKWNEEKEILLYKGLNYIHKHGGSFMLSNVMENNGQVNKILKAWSKSYTVIDIPLTYKNCNYQRKNQGKTREVVVKNY